jgi:toxin-antitoxin system PIN domain toxin
MKIVDANVLLYATDENARHHRVSKGWLEEALVDTEPIGLAWVVLLGFIRISTNPRVYVNPLTPDQATSIILKWLAQRATFVVEPTERHAHVLAGLLRVVSTGGNLVTDADIAALALEHQAEVVTFDSDFGRFTGVRWSSPALRPDTGDESPEAEVNP